MYDFVKDCCHIKKEQLKETEDLKRNDLQEGKPLNDVNDTHILFISFLSRKKYLNDLDS